MIYLQLFWAFLRVGLFAFGGAYGAIPLIRDIVLANEWMSDEMFVYLVAISESTPGPIMVNMATYIGSSQAGVLGAVLATTGVVLPAFVIILVIASLLKNFIDNEHVQAVLNGIRPCFIGIILAVGVFMVVSNVIETFGPSTADWRAGVITVILFALSFSYRHIKQKDLSPIIMIIISAALGIGFYGFV